MYTSFIKFSQFDFLSLVNKDPHHHSFVIRICSHSANAKAISLTSKEMFCFLIHWIQCEQVLRLHAKAKIFFNVLFVNWTLLKSTVYVRDIAFAFAWCEFTFNSQYKKNISILLQATQNFKRRGLLNRKIQHKICVIQIIAKIYGTVKSFSGRIWWCHNVIIKWTNIDGMKNEWIACLWAESHFWKSEREQLDDRHQSKRAPPSLQRSLSLCVNRPLTGSNLRCS